MAAGAGVGDRRMLGARRAGAAARNSATHVHVVPVHAPAVPVLVRQARGGLALVLVLVPAAAAGPWASPTRLGALALVRGSAGVPASGRWVGRLATRVHGTGLAVASATRLLQTLGWVLRALARSRGGALAAAVVAAAAIAAGMVVALSSVAAVAGWVLWATASAAAAPATSCL